MTYPSASTPDLLTREQVGLRLDLTPQSVDGLVRSGELSPVRLSSVAERRFWPDEIMAYALRTAIDTEAVPSLDQLRARSERPLTSAPPALATAARTVALVRNGRKSRHPAWPPFTGPTRRPAPAYIGFADRDDLVTYLRHRAEVELA
jgi:hypothetical protein